MAKIKQLSYAEAQKIAAGEVVDRPANVVKELIENSIDAGANQISIYLENGGKKLIHIIDNGSGMSVEDAYMCIKHHTTSKIERVEDLATIKTFGFRGEALSSISSVSKFTLKTKEETSQTGITLEVTNSAITNETINAANTGTEILVADLFYNVPARKKFLKTKETEWRAIVQLFYAFCLDYTNICFKLYSENKLIYNFPATQDLSKRLSQLYELELYKNLLFIESQDEKMGMKLTGSISNGQYNRYDRQQIYFFVNNRWIKNYKLSQALLKGYQNILQKDKYPAAFLFLTIDTQHVDINIHPRKEEVQFLHPKIVEEFVQSNVKQRLEQYLEQNLGHNKQIVTERATAISSFWPINNKIAEQAQNINFIKQTQNHETQNKEIQSQEFLTILNSQFKSQQEPQAEQNINSELISKENFLDYQLIGQVLLTYIIIQTQEGLVFIDQHAAHERIMYEQFRKKFDDTARIKLLFPQIINLNQSDINIIQDYIFLFKEFGVISEVIGSNEIVITETPVFLKNQSLLDIFKQTVGWVSELDFVEQNQMHHNIREKIHAQMSCKAAIKAGDHMNTASMHELIKNLYKIENKLTCPHGRPTIWVLSQPEIEKKFKRNYR